MIDRAREVAAESAAGNAGAHTSAARPRQHRARGRERHRAQDDGEVRARMAECSQQAPQLPRPPQRPLVEHDQLVDVRVVGEELPTQRAGDEQKASARIGAPHRADRRERQHHVPHLIVLPDRQQGTHVGRERDEGRTGPHGARQPLRHPAFPGALAPAAEAPQARPGCCRTKRWSHISRLRIDRGHGSSVSGAPSRAELGGSSRPCRPRSMRARMLWRK